MNSLSQEYHFQSLGREDAVTESRLAELFLQWTALAPRSAVFLLEGPLGVGKTHFLKAGLRVLGIDVVVSPTFTFCNEYQAPQLEIWHWDLYRVQTSEDLEAIGFFDQWQTPPQKTWIFVEWPERVSDRDWPQNWPLFKIKFSLSENLKDRNIEIFKRRQLGTES